MDKTNKDLLSNVIKDRLDRALIADPENEGDKQIFKEAMEALNKQIELDKIEVSHDEQLEKLKIENERLKAECEKNLRDEEAKKREARKDRWTQIGLFVAGMTIGELVDYVKKMGFAKQICYFEKENTFISGPGRSLSGLFRFKK